MPPFWLPWGLAKINKTNSDQPSVGLAMYDATRICSGPLTVVKLGQATHTYARLEVEQTMANETPLQLYSIYLLAVVKFNHLFCLGWLYKWMDMDTGYFRISIVNHRCSILLLPLAIPGPLSAAGNAKQRHRMQRHHLQHHAGRLREMRLHGER